MALDIFIIQHAQIRRRQERTHRWLVIVLIGIICAILVLILQSLRLSGTELGLSLLGMGALGVSFYRLLTKGIRERARIRQMTFPPAWKAILELDVDFYQNLTASERTRFQEEVHIFLKEKRITGINMTVNDRVRVLVAASAIIPIFGFPGWEWGHIREVLVYPTSFNHHFQTGEGKNRDILGMVGSGAMNRLMILSMPDLLQGFHDARDRRNVGIHEFVHLVDKSDGMVDGVPEVALPSKAIIPWLRVMHREMDKMRNGRSDINPYGLTNEAEFFAVVSEYFFENPEKMANKHPELWEMLGKIFQQDPRSRITQALHGMIRPKHGRLGRNVLCPCGSGKKFKKCCLAETNV